MKPSLTPYFNWIDFNKFMGDPSKPTMSASDFISQSGKNLILETPYCVEGICTSQYRHETDFCAVLLSVKHNKISQSDNSTQSQVLNLIQVWSDKKKIYEK